VLLPSITCFCPKSQSFDIFIFLLSICYNSKWYNVITMATGVTPIYDLPYPLFSDQVNVHEDVQSLAEQLELILPTIGLPYHTLEVTNNSGVTISKGDPVYISGFATSKPTITKCDSDDLDTFPVIGLAQAAIANTNDGVIVLSGVFTPINTNSYNAGDILYVANGGGLTATQPVTGSGAVAVVAKKSSSTGILIVGQPKGNGTWGSLKAGLA